MTRAARPLAALLLAGCASAPQNQISAPAERQAAVSAPAPVAAPARAAEADVLAGLKPAELQARLGAPGFVRRDRGVEVWQYRGRDCVLHLFLYVEGADGLKVTHTEVRDAAGRLISDQTGTRACVEAISPRPVVG